MISPLPILDKTCSSSRTVSAEKILKKRLLVSFLPTSDLLEFFAKLISAFCNLLGTHILVVKNFESSKFRLQLFKHSAPKLRRKFKLSRSDLFNQWSSSQRFLQTLRKSTSRILFLITSLNGLRQRHLQIFYSRKYFFAMVPWFSWFSQPSTSTSPRRSSMVLSI